MELTKRETEVLKGLAGRYMELATMPSQAEKARMWKALNENRMERPMVAIDQLPWFELNWDGFLDNQVEEPYFRGVETGLRHAIRQMEIFPADTVLTPYLRLPKCIHGVGYAEYGIKVQKESLATDPVSDVYSSRFENQFTTLEDVEKIKAPEVWEDTAKEAAIREIADTIFSGIAPYRMPGVQLHLGLWDFIAQWMGVEAIYIDLMDDPDLLHAIMEKTTSETIRKIETLDKIGGFDAYTNTCHCSYTVSDALPHGIDAPDRPRAKDVWAFGLAQLFTSVSPEVTAEYEVPYMQRLFPYFGSIYYGCCDRLDDRLDVIDRMPNIRKISCSPWSHREAFAQKLDHKYIMSNKPTPALIATESVDWEAVRADLRRTVDAARSNGVRLEMILKDISTVRYDPSRLTRWSEIALEEAARY